MEGYGLYWYCLELIAQNVEKHNLSFELEHDAEIIAADTGIHFELVQEMMMFMVDLQLFESDNGIITCLKLASRTDEYTQKLIKQLGSVPTPSRQSPDKVRSNRIEKKRKEKKKEGAARLPQGGKRCPDDFELSAGLSSFAMNRGFTLTDTQEELAKFKDCEFPRPHKDWPATWRNWIRRAHASRKERVGEVTAETTADYASKLGLMQGADEPEDKFKIRVRDAMISQEYGAQG